MKLSVLKYDINEELILSGPPPPKQEENCSSDTLTIDNDNNNAAAAATSTGSSTAACDDDLVIKGGAGRHGEDEDNPKDEKEEQVHILSPNDEKNQLAHLESTLTLPRGTSLAEKFGTDDPKELNKLIIRSPNNEKNQRGHLECTLQSLSLLADSDLFGTDDEMIGIMQSLVPISSISAWLKEEPKKGLDFRNMCLSVLYEMFTIIKPQFVEEGNDENRTWFSDCIFAINLCMANESNDVALQLVGLDTFLILTKFKDAVDAMIDLESRSTISPSGALKSIRTSSTSGALKSIRQVMMCLHPSNSAIQEKGCLILNKLATSSGGSSVVVVLYEGIDPVLTALKTHPKHRTIQTIGIAFLKKWNLHPTTKNELTSLVPAGVIGILVNASGVLGGQLTYIQADIWLMLFKLVRSNQETRDALVMSGGIQAAIGILRYHCKLEDLPLNATLLLEYTFRCLVYTSKTTRSPGFISAMVGGKGLAAILDLMTKHVANGKMQYWSCSVLLELSRRGNAESQQAIIEGLGVFRIMTTIKKHKATPDVLGGAFAVVTSLLLHTSSGDDQWLQHAVATGLLESLTTATKKYPEDFGVSRHGSMLLYTLCKHIGTSGIMANDGLSAVLSLLGSSHLDEGHVEATMEVLNLCMDASTDEDRKKESHETVADKGGIAVLVAVMQKQPSNRFIQQSAIAVLEGLLLYCPTSFQEFLKGNAIDATIQAMAKHADDRDLQIAGGYVLDLLMDPFESPLFLEATECIKQKGGLDVVADALWKFPKDKELVRCLDPPFGYLIEDPLIIHEID